jgi:glycosyltransferase involved in cell wall biosynthesis
MPAPAPSTRHVAVFDAYPHLYYGAQRVAHALVGGLPGQGWSAELIVPGPGPLVSRARADGITVTVVRAPDALTHFGGATRRLRAAGAAVALIPYWLRLARYLRGRATVVHANDHRGLVLAGPAALLAGVPLVWQVHSARHSRVLNAIGSRIADEVVVCSRGTIDASPGLMRSRPPTIIANGLPAEVLDREEVRPGPDPFLVSAGRIHPDKGFDVLVDALARLRGSHGGLRVLVMGDATDGYERYAEELRHQSQQLAPEILVELPGWIDKPEERWVGAWLYVQPSRREPWGLAVAEAMAAGIPVVATRAGGLPEVVDDGRTGLLVPVDDAGALAGAIDRVLSDRALARALATAARAHAKLAFTIDRMVAATSAVYERTSHGRERCS